MFKYLKNTIGISIFVITIILGVYIIDALADNEVNLPGTVTQMPIGSQAWIDPNNVKLDDGNVATCFYSSGRTTSMIRGDNFGFAIPTDATIDGVEFKVEKSQSASSAVDKYVYLTDSNISFIGDNKADTGTQWTGTLTSKKYGGATDKWGTTLTPAIINDSDFGVAISATLNNSTVSIDYLQLTVYYTTSSGEAGIVSLAPAF